MAASHWAMPRACPVRVNAWCAMPTSRRRPSAWLVALIALLAIPPVATARAETLKVAIKNRQFYAQADAAGTPVTFESALIQELCTAMHATCELQFMPFAAVLPSTHPAQNVSASV